MTSICNLLLRSIILEIGSIFEIIILNVCDTCESRGIKSKINYLSVQYL